MRFFCALIAAIIVLGCTATSDYEALEKKELAKGVRQDSLFLGLKFGITSKEFFDHCWELNKKGLLTQGGLQTGGIAAKYKLINEFSSPVFMNFYPVFYKGKIFQMNTDFNYEAWAPWNRRFFSDSLQWHVIDLFEKWYGKGFIRLSDSQKNIGYVKIDGNRRITVSIFSEQYVTAVFTDLIAEKEIQKGQRDKK